MKPIFFASPSDFRKWLEQHHASETEVLVGFYKVGTGKPSMTWTQSVDQALCFGWIDGVRRSIDASRYSIRFTPRKSKSNWSAINIRKVKELSKAGLMTAAGKKAFENGKKNREEAYSYEKTPAALTDYYIKQFKKSKTAWEFFNAQPPSYKKVIVHWIMNAKQEKTRLARLEKAIHASERKKRVT